jgi:hypothetical protein
MSSIVKDIKTYLTAHGCSTDAIYLNCQPDTPNDLIAITKYGGIPGGLKTEHRVQVLVRNISAITAENKINAIRNLLNPTNPEAVIQLTSTRTATIKALQEPFPLFQDDKNRFKFVCNFRVLSSRD